MLSNIETNIEEGLRKRKTLAGEFTRPSGTFDNPMAKFTLYLPSIDYLKDIFPERYNAPSAPQTTGNIIVGDDSCTTLEVGGFNIHFECEDNDSNDVYFYEAQAQLSFNAKYTTEDDISIEIAVYAQPTASGSVRFGTGDLTQESIYDPATDTTVPATS
jgi:hypothetical protein